ncbi:MAG: CvpA family protein [Gammaproteobacteria bacterium]|jgi:membrane protein required for colicin V production|nr:CvpA family protein [Gammaproteobacteria bacterium]
MSWFDLQAYSLFDWLIIAIFLLSVVVSTMRGFVREALALTAWGIAIWLAYIYAVDVSEYLSPHIASPSVRLGLTVIGMFAMVLIASVVLRVMILYAISVCGLSFLDHILGSIFGFIRATVILLLFVILMQTVHLNQDSWWKDSVLLPYIEALAEKVPSQVPQKVMQILNGFSETVQEA